MAGPRRQKRFGKVAGPARPGQRGHAQPYVTAEVSPAAVRANLAALRERLEPATRLCAVVKSDGYGHGIDLLLPVFREAADCLAVCTPAEALHLRDLGYGGDVLMFFPPGYWGGEADQGEVLEELLAGGVTLTVCCPAAVEAIGEAARRAAAPAPEAGFARRGPAAVHVKVDTGMTRSGALPADVPALVGCIGETDGVNLTGMYTHFAAADESDKGSAREQHRRFLSVVDACGLGGEVTLHAANSAAIIDLPETQLDMVRPGISAYGYQPSDEMHNRLPLRPALRVWAPLMQVKDIPAGSGCGYGLTFTFDRPARVGLVPIGYGDGYFRSLSNRATMRIRGADAPIRGRVSMDQVILDLTDVPGAAVGDEVEIISPDPAAPHSVENLARLAGTIPYEITCRLTGPRIRRVAAD
ncbi:MAG TPA: alanine racemase [Phycisphaerae bacterium]|nr:alanine racemase [Phycisphaerae bacterium]